MEWWQVLEVPEDADLRQVKKAYAQKIKKYRPDEHPEQFSDIRQAFDYARKVLKQVEIERQVFQEEEIAEETSKPTTISANGTFDSATENQPEALNIEVENADREESGDIFQSGVEEYFDLLQTWHRSDFKDLKTLQTLLTHGAIDDFDQFEELHHRVFHWLVEVVAIKSGFLSTTTNIPFWQIAELDRVFGWQSKEGQLYEHYYGRDLSLIFHAIQEGMKDKRFGSGHTNIESNRSWLGRFLGK